MAILIGQMFYPIGLARVSLATKAMLHQRKIAVALLALVAATASAQSKFALQGEYAQFRNISGLNGGGYGVDSKGKITLDGAFSFSTPIAYSIGGGQVSLSLSNTSFDQSFRFFEKKRKNDYGFESNGTASINVGIDSSIGQFTVGMMVVSGAFENAYNAHFTPKQKSGKFIFGVGVQGLFAAGGFIGPGLAEDSADRSTSLYGVGTWQVDDRTHISAGIGTSRFRHGFANVSYKVTDGVKAFVEHDGIDFNYGAGFSIGTYKLSKDRTMKFTGTVAMVARRYASWSLNVSF